MPLPDDSYPKNIILKGIATYRLEYSEHKVELRRPRRRLDDLCTPGINVINLTTWFIVHIECPSVHLMIALKFATRSNGFSCRNEDGMQLHY